MSKIFNFQNKKKGFSMGEVLISVFILGVTMVTILQLFVVSLKNFANSRDSIIASMLAQEGLELVKNIRDNNWVNGDSTFDKMHKTSASGGNNTTCIVDINNVSCDTSNEVDCRFDDTADANCSLYFNNNFYTHTHNGTKTKFKRGIKIIVAGNDRRVITSQVSWDTSKKIPNINKCNIANKCVFSETILTTWGE